jgi:prolyl-tRNA editing enzyme YbaK/EbsC (Cys-tRNA(Pro) deacylase)
VELHPLVASHLESLAVPHHVMSCDPALADTAAFCASYGVDPADSANTIIVISRKPAGVAAACVVLASTRLDVNHRLRSELGVRKLSFAGAEETAELTQMMIGGVTAFGLPTHLPVLVDSAVMERTEIVLGGGNRSTKLRMSPECLSMLPSMRVIEGLARPFETGSMD